MAQATGHVQVLEPPRPAEAPQEPEAPRRRWHLGILSSLESGEEVPGSILFIGKENEPLGLDKLEEGKSQEPLLKRGPAGIILDPQPDDHESDPLNWPTWRREAALWTIGLYSLIGGGQTPILAAGFNNVAAAFGVSTADVALTTGIYMLGLALGAVIVSPFAIIYGKRPLYLAGAVLFCAASIWSAASPSYASLVVARLIMGIGVSPCECLPSAYLSEIFYLHERGFRLGIYTLLLLGGKNLVPLVSGIIIEAKGWRWVFWIVSIIVGALVFLLFLFVPETYWVRYAHAPQRPSLIHRLSGLTRSSLHIITHKHGKGDASKDAKDGTSEKAKAGTGDGNVLEGVPPEASASAGVQPHPDPQQSSSQADEQPQKEKPKQATLADLPGHKSQLPNLKYTRHGPKASFKSQLSVYNGRLREDSFWKSLARPMVLFAYPAILWSTVVYSLSVVWLIVLSETVAHIYQTNPYNFNQLQTGMVYISPFIGGVLGSAVAGKLSDAIVKFMAKKNDGIYEPEFRLVMGIGVAIATSAGLMG
ncbi:hypothetical protein TWF696_009411 [Orbilia brochopaga]|uniref:Major facilitator superfamily (MFS) profile domain-containing protein n=1 Tax=Orbilia brochopaga TaxID=3140254 RepID=A0AAV9UCS6_9PEZI